MNAFKRNTDQIHTAGTSVQQTQVFSSVNKHKIIGTNLLRLAGGGEGEGDVEGDRALALASALALAKGLSDFCSLGGGDERLLCGGGGGLLQKYASLYFL